MQIYPLHHYIISELHRFVAVLYHSVPNIRSLNGLGAQLSREKDLEPAPFYGNLSSVLSPTDAFQLVITDEGYA